MEQILFVNACMRGPKLSRTWRLSQAFLAACQACWPQAEIVERDLTGCELPVLSGPMTDRRDRCFHTNPQDPMFARAREMSRADLVVVAAPYWDLSFPAALKIYLEWASVLGITFHYTDQGVQEGLCRAEHLVYITTAGGMIGEKTSALIISGAWEKCLASTMPTFCPPRGWISGETTPRLCWTRPWSRPGSWPAGSEVFSCSRRERLVY